MRHVLVPKSITPGELPRGRISALHGESMGTSWSVRFVQNGLQSEAGLQHAVQRELDEVVEQMSHWDARSNLSQYNAGAAGSRHALPDAFYEVLCCALDVAGQSGGAYDPAAGAIVNLWGFGPDKRYQDKDFSPPSPEAIRQALDRGNWQGISVEETQRMALQPGGLLLDFSSIAKGFGVDRVAQCLDEQGIHHYLVDVGGELRGAGVKPDGQPWWVGIEHPGGDMPGKEAFAETVLALHGLSVASSGDYRRYVDLGGRRYAHTLDPRTGYPIVNGVASVTVIHPRCMLADAWSTALTVLGVEEGVHVAEERKLAARFVVRSGQGMREHATTAWKDMLQ